MLCLWPRAAQVRRRGCRASSTAVRAVGRRGATAARRRKPTVADLFTACYSSMFATAAIVDAVHKEDRRRELDRQLDEARRELSDLQSRSARHAPGADVEPDMTVSQMDALWRCLKSIYADRPFMKEIHKPATASASELVANLKSECYGCLAEETMRRVRQTDYGRLERAILAEECDKSIVGREPRNLMQLLRESESVEHVVGQLLRRAEALEQSPTPSPSFYEACDLAARGDPHFTFRSIDPRGARENTKLLNRKLRCIVDAKNLSLRERIGRICYNLLVSAHPPDMHTYNTLIVAFDKTGRHVFSDALVYSFFHGRLLRPTPSTFVAILNHYKVTSNHGQFLRALACLTGADSRTGAKIARRHILDIDSNLVLLKWASNTKLRTRTGDWVWEHVPLHRALVEEVIAGLLHFKLFEQAADFFLTCARSGVALSARVVKQVLDECILALDWRASLRLVRSLIDSSMWKTLLLSGDGATNSYLVGRVYVLLDLCGLHSGGQPASEACLANLGICGLQLGRFLESLEESRLEMARGPADALARPAAADEAARGTRPKSRLLQLESIWKEYVTVRRTTMSIESKLLYPEFSLDFRMAMALHIGTAAAERAAQLIEDCAERLSGLPPPPPASQTGQDDAEGEERGRGRRARHAEDAFRWPTPRAKRKGAADGELARRVGGAKRRRRRGGGGSRQPRFA